MRQFRRFLLAHTQKRGEGEKEPLLLFSPLMQQEKKGSFSPHCSPGVRRDGSSRLDCSFRRACKPASLHASRKVEEEFFSSKAFPPSRVIGVSQKRERWGENIDGDSFPQISAMGTCHVMGAEGRGLYVHAYFLSLLVARFCFIKRGREPQ